MGEVYVIADLHLGHKLMTRLRGFDTVEEHDREIVSRWNDTVTNKRDVVWVLGDVLFGSRSFDLLPKLRGIKKLILGNHDHYPLERYQQHFSKVHGMFEYDGCLMTHIPVAATQFKRYKLNVHGHMHAKSMGDPRYVCVSAEHNDLRPRLLRPLLTRWAGEGKTGCPDGPDGAEGVDGCDVVAQVAKERQIRSGPRRIG